VRRVIGLECTTNKISHLSRATLEKEWSQFTPLDQADCTRLMTSGGSPSYVELLTCLEMAKQVKELPGGDQLDSGKPVEKSRHIK
jgi:hypothetical protein